MAITLTILTLRHLIRQYQYVIPVYRHMSIYISFGYNSLLLCIIGSLSYMYLGYMYRLNIVNIPSTMLDTMSILIEYRKKASIRSGMRLRSMTGRLSLFIKKNLVKLRYTLRLVMSIIDVCATIIDVL